MRIAQVLIPLPLPEAFDYAEPEDMGLAIGDVVAAPLGPRLVRGVVTGLRDATRRQPGAEGGGGPHRDAAAAAREPRLHRMGGALRGRPAGPAAGDRPARLDGGAAQRPERVTLLTGKPPTRMTPAREKVLAAAAEAELSPAALARAAGVSSGVVSALIADGVLAETLREAPVDFPAPDPDHARPTLNASQAAALAELEAMIGRGRLRRRAARRRHRLRQDRGLPGGGRRCAAARSGRPGADPAAGDRPHRSGDRPHRRAFRRRAGRLALRDGAARAAGGSGRRSRAASAGSWSAPARRSSCRSRA